MFQLDDKFLSDIGLADLPDEQKKPFLQHIYDQLEYRVGVRLSEGMSDTQLEEFEAIIDRKEDVVNNWIQTNAPGYAAEEIFQKIQQTSGLDANNPALKAEYAATKWLEVNRPDYRDVVAKTLDELKNEINQNRDAILQPNAADAGEQAQPGQDQPAA